MEGHPRGPPQSCQTKDRRNPFYSHLSWKIPHSLKPHRTKIAAKCNEGIGTPNVLIMPNLSTTRPIIALGVIKSAARLPAQSGSSLEFVCALIYTSSSFIHVRSNKSFLTEDAPLVDRSTSTDEYAITKAIADTMVLEADGSKLRTVCLRMPGIYGERDTQMIPGSLEVLWDGKTHMQLGKNQNLFDAVYVGNAAWAHVLAAKALLSGDARAGVAGEAFFITNDAAIPFWDFQREIYAAAGHTTDRTQVRVIPAWAGMRMAALV
ncbi:MAG: hypothetical protein Q9169_007063, partial [Polycauliona sp. 2 TL-2023]